MTFQSKKTLKVQQDGNTLVAAYRTANPPLIWKFDLERNHSFSLALQGEDGDWELGVLSPKEDFHPVARFLSREDAEEAFAKTQKALLTKKRNSWKITAIIFIVISVYLLLVNISHHSARPMQALMSSQQAPAPVPMKDGEPEPADQVLKPP